VRSLPAVIDEKRANFGLQPICRALLVAASTYDLILRSGTGAQRTPDLDWSKLRCHTAGKPHNGDNIDRSSVGFRWRPAGARSRPVRLLAGAHGWGRRRRPDRVGAPPHPRRGDSELAGRSSGRARSPLTFA